MTVSAPTPSCPLCGTAEARRIVWGYPTADLFADPDIVIGGCMVTGGAPSYQCRNPACGHEFGRRRGQL
jgi:hypothetical protein